MIGYSTGEVWEIYENLYNLKKIEVLNEAIDHMESANFQSKTEVIFKAMGFKYDEDSEKWCKC